MKEENSAKKLNLDARFKMASDNLDKVDTKLSKYDGMEKIHEKDRRLRGDVLRLMSEAVGLLGGEFPDG